MPCPNRGSRDPNPVLHGIPFLGHASRANTPEGVYKSRGPAPGTQSSHRNHRPPPRSSLRSPSRHPTIQAEAHRENDLAIPKPRLYGAESSTRPSPSAVIFRSCCTTKSAHALARIAVRVRHTRGKGHARTLELLSFQKESLVGAAGSNQKDIEDAQAIDSGRLQNGEKPQNRLVLGLSAKLHSGE